MKKKTKTPKTQAEKAAELSAMTWGCINIKPDCDRLGDGHFMGYISGELSGEPDMIRISSSRGGLRRQLASELRRISDWYALMAKRVESRETIEDHNRRWGGAS